MEFPKLERILLDWVVCEGREPVDSDGVQELGFVLESTPEFNVITVYDGASEGDRVPSSTRGVEGSGVLVLSEPRLRLREESSSVLRTLR